MRPVEESRVRRQLTTAKGKKLTLRREALAGDVNFDDRLHSSSVLGAAGEEATGDQVVHLLVVACEVVDVRSGVDGRMSLIVLLAVAGSLKAAVGETVRQ
jgi:hypothetical protein